MSGTTDLTNVRDLLCFNELISESNGGRVLFATDDFFAPAENLLKDAEPIWRQDAYTEFGKWMDGWETRRRRQPGHDWAIIRMPADCDIRGVCVDTCHFTGNYAPRFSLAAAFLDKPVPDFLQDRNSRMGTGATEQEKLNAATLGSEDWETLIPMTELKPGSSKTRKNYFAVNASGPWNCLRLNIFPDGGVARLRVYGVVTRIWNVLQGPSITDLVSKENGGVCAAYSNAHFGHPRNLIKPGPATGMADGWETARDPARPPVVRIKRQKIQTKHSEWVIFKLGCAGSIHKVIVDTSHFRGNYPHDIKIRGAIIDAPFDSSHQASWMNILPTKMLSPHAVREFTVPKARRKCFTHVKVIIRPDGGFARLRLLGRPSSDPSSSESSIISTASLDQ